MSSENGFYQLIRRSQGSIDVTPDHKKAKHSGVDWHEEYVKLQRKNREDHDHYEDLLRIKDDTIESLSDSLDIALSNDAYCRLSKELMRVEQERDALMDEVQTLREKLREKGSEEKELSRLYQFDHGVGIRLGKKGVETYSLADRDRSFELPSILDSVHGVEVEYSPGRGFRIGPSRQRKEG